MSDISTDDREPKIPADFAERIQKLSEVRTNRWAEMCERNGWPTDAKCQNCGDTGTHHEGWRCTCSMGRIKEEQEERLKEWVTLVPERFQDYRLWTSPATEAAEQIRNWGNRLPWRTGQNLILVGPVGTGKTGLLIGACGWIHDWGCRFKFTSVPQMIDQMRPGEAEDPMDRLIRIQVLALDDLGVEKPSDWVRERLYVLINGRYEAKRSTLVTTNCNLGQLAEAIGERTVSRLQEGATILTVGGKDLRRQ